MEMRRGIRRRGGLLAAVGVALGGALVPGLGAQITGTAVSQSGDPLEGVLVEAWSADRRVITRITDFEGRFTFPAAVAEVTTALYAHRLGYHALRTELQEGVTEYLLRMSEAPIAIEGLVVSVDPPVCSRREDAEARALWSAMARRYSSGIDTLGVATYVSGSIQAVSHDGIGPVAVGSAGTAQRGSAPLFRASWRRRVDRSGYARPLSAPSSDGTYEAWGYPPLEADFAVHFGDEVFGEQHRFTMEGERDGGWIVRFCPKDPDDPHIRGILQIGGDTLLKVAEWSFVTDEPHEDAGGRATFGAEMPLTAAAFLLPTEGLFWRRTRHNQYIQRYERYEGWIVAPGDSVPFLPVRGKTEPSSTRNPS